MFELSFGVERPGGKSGIVNSHQAPSPVLCLHSASSSVWEDRGKARLSLARCFWKQFSYPAEPEGEYYNRGRDRRPIYHRVVTLRENKLFFPACHGAQVDANWVTKFLSEKLRPVLEPSGTSIMGNSSRAINTGLQFLPGHADSGTNTHTIVCSSAGDVLWTYGSGDPPNNTSIHPLGLCCQALMRLSPTAKCQPPLPPRQLGFASSLPTLAIDSWEILLANSFFPPLKTHSLHTS